MVKIIIIGAGIGGLSTAIRLQHAGYQVAIYEKNPQVGGKMYQYEQDGFRWDTGPSVITMRHVFEDLFNTTGRKLEDYLDFQPVDPLTRYFYPDGRQLDIMRDLSQTIQQIETIEPRDVAGYLRYLAYAAEIHRITGPVFIYNQPPTLKSFTQVNPTEWLKADPLRTMYGAIKQHVKSSHLRQLLGRFATYVGGNPYVAPATLNVIAHVELSGGVWYPRGGIYKIATALEKLALELGVEIHTSAPIQQINVTDRKATGVTLADGTQVLADAVIANADVTTAINHLLPANTVSQDRRQQLNDFEPSCSGFILMLGVEGEHPELAHHNIFFSRDYRAEFGDIFQKGIPPQDPTIYAAITSKTDPDHAPAGHENWFILVNAPALSDHYEWSSNTDLYRDHVLNTLARHGVDIRDKIRTETIWTPRDLQEKSGAWRGALYGPSANNRFSVFRRPHNRSRDLKNLYFVGGTTHPGGGVPMVMLSGKVTAEFVMEDHILS